MRLFVAHGAQVIVRVDLGECQTLDTTMEGGAEKELQCKRDRSENWGLRSPGKPEVVYLCCGPIPWTYRARGEGHEMIAAIHAWKSTNQE
jgi:hypothetical protein